MGRRWPRFHQPLFAGRQPFPQRGDELVDAHKSVARSVIDVRARLERIEAAADSIEQCVSGSLGKSLLGDPAVNDRRHLVTIRL